MRRRKVEELPKSEQRTPVPAFLADDRRGSGQNEGRGAEQNESGSEKWGSRDPSRKLLAVSPEYVRGESDGLRHEGLGEKRLEERVAISILDSERAEYLKGEEGRSERGDPEPVRPEDEKPGGGRQGEDVKTGHIPERVIPELGAFRDPQEPGRAQNVEVRPEERQNDARAHSECESRGRSDGRSVGEDFPDPVNQENADHPGRGQTVGEQESPHEACDSDQGRGPGPTEESLRECEGGDHCTPGEERRVGLDQADGSEARLRGPQEESVAQEQAHEEERCGRNPATSHDRVRPEEEPHGPGVENEVRNAGELEGAIRGHSERPADCRDRDDVRRVGLGLISGDRHCLVRWMEEIPVQGGDSRAVAAEVGRRQRRISEAVDAEIEDEEKHRGEPAGRFRDGGGAAHRAWNGKEKRKFQSARR